MAQPNDALGLQAQSETAAPDRRGGSATKSKGDATTEIQQSRLDGWAIVDVLGHQRYVGYVTTEAYGQAVLFRIDVPPLEERERVTKAPGYINGRGYCPAGTTVQE